MNLDYTKTPKHENNSIEKASSLSKLLEQLSLEQAEAVQYINNSSIISAGAGSGKTRVLTYKIAYLISCVGVSPSSILALTFTNKAANEMKSRVYELLDNRSLSELWIGTFHSIFLKILRENHEFLREKYKLNQHFLIYDQKSKNTVLEMIIEKHIKEYKAAKKSNDRKILQEILFEISDDISKVKNEGKSFDECIKDENFELNHYSKVHLRSIYKDYIHKCRNSNAMDFDDILLYTYKMLKDNEEIRQKYKDKFKYILVDEYQDTNTIQFNIIELIHGKYCKICVVGDDAQCIYSFRGSKIENIQKFREQYSPLEFKLSVNYRSTKTIVEAANKLIQNNEGQSSKILYSNTEENKSVESKIKIISAEDDKDEARKVAQKIVESRNLDKNLNDWDSFAILYRTHKQAEPFEIQLKNSGIPYKIVGKIKFLEREIIVHIISYLRVIINERYNISLQKIFTFSFSNISLKMKKIFDNADKNKMLYWNEINNLDSSKDNDYKKVESFIKFINFLKEKVSTEEPYFFIGQIIDFIKLEKKMISFSFDEEDEQLINLLKQMTLFLTDKYYTNSIINGKENSDDEEEKLEKTNNKVEDNDLISEDKSLNKSENNEKLIIKYRLKEFLDDLILLNTNEDLSEDISNINSYLGNSNNLKTLNKSNKVKLMTIHSSKGLEFNTVFIVGVEKGYYPIYHPSVKDKKKHEEEERRMFYVAITRAKQNCFISYAQKRLMGTGKVMNREKSQFINELENKCLDFTGDIINDDNNIQNNNNFSFKKSLFSQNLFNDFNKNFNSNYKNKNYTKYKDKNFFKNKNRFINKKRYNAN